MREFNSTGLCVPAKHSLDVDVVGPAAHAVHALPDVVAAQAVDVALRGVSRALVRIADGGAPAPLNRLLHADDGLLGLDGVVEPPANDEAAEKVDYGGQVDVAAPSLHTLAPLVDDGTKPSVPPTSLLQP